MRNDSDHDEQEKDARYYRSARVMRNPDYDDDIDGDWDDHEDVTDYRTMRQLYRHR